MARDSCQLEWSKPADSEVSLQIADPLTARRCFRELVEALPAGSWVRLRLNGQVVLAWGTLAAGSSSPEQILAVLIGGG